MLHILDLSVLHFIYFVFLCSCSDIYYKQFRLSQEASVIFTTKSFADKNHTVTP